MWWLHYDEREPGRGGGWANADGVLVAAMFVLLRVTEVVNGVVLRVVVGVVRAADMLGDLPSPVVPACDDTAVMTRGMTLTRPINDSG